MAAITRDKPIRVGVFAEVAGAECAVKKLIHAGFPKEHLTVMCSDATREKHFGMLRHSTEGFSRAEKPVLLESGLIGGMVGGLVSLAGVAVTGGLGILAVGPIVAGGITGTLVGLFVGHGVEDEVARFYDQSLARGSILVAVDEENPARLAEASRVFEECGSEAIPLDGG